MRPTWIRWNTCAGPVVSASAKYSNGARSKLYLTRYNSLVSYQDASKIQDLAVQERLAIKRATATTSGSALHGNDVNNIPPPMLLAFEMQPTYTGGRRQNGHFSKEELALMNANGATFVQTKRGGQTTFHGPGQIVLYPIIDLRQFGLKVRCYVRLIENSIIQTLEEYNIKSFVTEDTGVWTSSTEKIAAIGIHVQRGITSHGLALNVSTDTAWFDAIVACGLPDKRTTTMRKQGCGAELPEVCHTLAQKIASNLGCDLELVNK